MKISEFISMCNNNNLDIDVYTDYTDDLAICYCGDESFGLTEEGQKEFGEVLELDIAVGKCNAIVKINHLDDETAEDMNDKLIRFFNACAGYVSESLYNKWFSC